MRVPVVVRSALVGAIATAADLLALAVLVDIFMLAPRIANVPSLALGIAAQFIGNKLFAFEDRSADWARQGALFLAVEAGAILLNVILFDRMVVMGAPYLLARLIGTALVYFGFSLPLWSRIFKRTEQAS